MGFGSSSGALFLLGTGPASTLSGEALDGHEPSPAAEIPRLPMLSCGFAAQVVTKLPYFRNLNLP